MKMMVIIMLIFAFSSLLYMSGITTNEGTAIGIINQLIQNGNIQDTSVYTSIFVIALITLAGGAVVTAVTFGNANASTVIASITMSALLANLISDFIFVINKVNQTCVAGELCTNWVYWVIFPVFITLGIGGLWSIYDYVIGND